MEQPERLKGDVMFELGKRRLHIGALLFQRVDQSDLTGPFEVLSRIPDSTFAVIGNDRSSVRDVRGLILTPNATFEETPPLDVLIVPGGAGQEDLMDDERTLSFIRQQAVQASFVFSVCTGALLCGAAGLLKGVRVTTHWAALHLLGYFGAIAVNARVVIDGKHISAAGVTAGLDGALQLVALLRGEDAAKRIQLSIEYAPDPPFHCGSPQTAPPELVNSVRLTFQEITESRLVTAKRIASRLGLTVPSSETG
jgi:cyclohexyl-isocyanide hydratase